MPRDAEFFDDDGDALDDETEPESDAAQRAYDDWYNLGYEKSVWKLIEYYETLPPSEVPTKNEKTLKLWHEKYNWPRRASERESRLVDLTDTLIAEDRAAVRRTLLRRQDDALHFIIQMIHDAEVEYLKARDAGRLTLEDYMKWLTKLMPQVVQLTKSMRESLGSERPVSGFTVEMFLEILPPDLRDHARQMVMQKFFDGGLTAIESGDS